MKEAELGVRSEKRVREVVASLISLAVNVAFWMICLEPKIFSAIHNKIAVANLLLFVISIILFFGCFVIVYHIVAKVKFGPFLKETPLGKPFFFALIILVFIGLFLVVFNEKTIDRYHSIVFWHSMPFGLVIICSILAYVAFFHFTNQLDNFSTDEKKYDSKMFWFIAAAVSLMVGYISYSPGLFFADRGTALHADAVYSSVYNVFYDTPLTMETYSIYGYYGVFLAPFLKIASMLHLSNTLNIFCILVSILMALTCLCSAYAINVFIKNKILKYLGVIAMVSATVWRGAFLSQRPLRVLPLAMIMALIAFTVQNPQKLKWTRVIGYILSAAAIVWNIETGISVALSWSAFMLAISWQKYKVRNLKFLRDTLIAVCMVPVCLFGAVGIVGLYNLSVGGDMLSLAQFVSVLTNGTFVGETLQRDLLPAGISAWMFLLLIAFAFISRSISATSLCKKVTEVQYQSASYLGLAILLLGSMVYYMNGASYGNLSITTMPAVLMVCIIAQSCLVPMQMLRGKWKQKISVAFVGTLVCGIAANFVLFALALGCLTNLGHSILRIDQLRQRESGIKCAEEIAQVVPEDTNAFGMGTTEVYSILGWDTQLHTMDYAGFMINQESRAYVTKLFDGLKEEDMLMTESTFGMLGLILPEVQNEFMATHKVQAEIGFIDEDAFLYFVPIT